MHKKVQAWWQPHSGPIVFLSGVAGLILTSWIVLASPGAASAPKFKVGTASCKTTKDGKAKTYPVSNPKLCRSRSEHRKMLQWKCDNISAVLTNFSVKDPCKS